MVKVTVVQDDKKVFERKGEFFAGTVIINSDEDIVAASEVAFGEANARDVTIALAELSVVTVRVASPSRTDYMINLKVLEKILHNHTAEKIQKILEDGQ